jgi:uncharacterized membrane protein YhiD involved in acid resistance
MLSTTSFEDSFEEPYDMDNLSSEFANFTDLGTAVSTGQMLLCLIISWLLCSAVAKVYQFTYRDASFSPAFMQTLVICGMVIGAVMLIIGSNIARAFSLVGALSIIRFRNAVKDPRDVAFIFLVMAIGMACGTGFYKIAIALTGTTCIAITLMGLFQFGSSRLEEKIVKIQAPTIKNFETLFDPILKNHSRSFSLVAAEKTQMGTEMELTFILQVSKNFKIEALMNELEKLNDHLRIQVLGTSFSYDL